MHKIIVAVSLVSVICYAGEEQKKNEKKNVTLKELNELAFEKYLEKHPDVVDKLEAKKNASLEEKLAETPDEALIGAVNACAPQ